MFTIAQIKAAHAKVKSGRDFPQYIQDLVQLGVQSYHTYVKDGHTVYFGDEGYGAASAPMYGPLAIAESADAKTFAERLKAHQAGETDYPTFCDDCAHAGVNKWVVDMEAMTCTYFDATDTALLVEGIPQ